MKAASLALLMLTAVVSTTAAREDAAVDAFIFRGDEDADVGLAAAPEVDLREVGLAADPSYVIATWRLSQDASRSSAVASNGMTRFLLEFDGSWVSHAILESRSRGSQVLFTTLRYDYSDGSFAGFDGIASNHTDETVTVWIPRTWFDGDLDHVSFRTEYIPCAAVVCLSKDATLIGDRAPNYGSYPPFDPENGIWS